MGCWSILGRSRTARNRTAGYDGCPATRRAGGTSNDNAPTNPDNPLSILDDVFITIGDLSGWVDEYGLPSTLAGAEVVVVVTQATSTAV